MKKTPEENARTRLSILDCITMINDESNKLLHDRERMKNLKPILTRVALFFNTDIMHASLISVMLCEQITGDQPYIKDVMKSLGFHTQDFVKAKDILKEFCIKGWIKMNGSHTGFMKFSVEFTPMVVDAVVKQDKKLLNLIPPGTDRKALQMMRAICKDVKYGSTDQETQDILWGFLERYGSFPLIVNLMKDKSLSRTEILALLWVCGEHLEEAMEMNLLSILDNLGESRDDVRLLTEDIKTGKSPLFKEKYLEFVIPNFADFTSVKPGEKTLQYLPPEPEKSERVSIFNPRICKLINPDHIKEQHLYFSHHFNKDADEVSRLISRELFPVIMDKCLKSNLPASATLLFYGPAGTGKTELVKQLAKRHNRAILMVDISQVKSMWVGESEKNLKRIFIEYRMARKHFDVSPILLFNEADALISKRIGINSSVDQMSNSMQNILLQELEDFKGIFVATTNLLDNIDPAFDRRLLFKLRFEAPNTETRLRILESQFGELPQSVLEEISLHPITGGQIMNVRKRHEIDLVLNHDPDTAFERLLQYVASETGFRQAGKRAIGFRRA